MNAQNVYTLYAAGAAISVNPNGRSETMFRCIFLKLNFVLKSILETIRDI